MLNSSELFEFLPHMTHDEKTLTLAMPLGQKIFFVTVFFCSAVWGSLMKFFIYYNVMREKFTERPINILILIDQVIEHITKTMTCFYVLIKVRVLILHDLQFSSHFYHSLLFFRFPLASPCLQY